MKKVMTSIVSVFVAAALVTTAFTGCSTEDSGKPGSAFDSSTMTKNLTADGSYKYTMTNDSYYVYNQSSPAPSPNIADSNRDDSPVEGSSVPDGDWTLYNKLNQALCNGTYKGDASGFPLDITLTIVKTTNSEGYLVPVTEEVEFKMTTDVSGNVSELKLPAVTVLEEDHSDEVAVYVDKVSETGLLVKDIIYMDVDSAKELLSEPAGMLDINNEDEIYSISVTDKEGIEMTSADAETIAGGDEIYVSVTFTGYYVYGLMQNETTGSKEYTVDPNLVRFVKLENFEDFITSPGSVFGMSDAEYTFYLDIEGKNKLTNWDIMPGTPIYVYITLQQRVIS